VSKDTWAMVRSRFLVLKSGPGLNATTQLPDFIKMSDEKFENHDLEGTVYDMTVRSRLLTDVLL
jgi:hypothetical protein